MQLIFLRKSDCLGCAVLLCFVCLFDLACFFLCSFSTRINPRRACAARVTVVVLSVCLSVTTFSAATCNKTANKR